MFTRLSPNLATESATIDGVYYIARVVEDDNPDTSYLDQEGWERRKRAYKRDDFAFCGVIVTAYDDDDRETGSASLWGIESDSGREYFCQVANELIEEVA